MTWNPTTPRTRLAARRLPAALALAAVIAWGGDTVSTQATIDCGPVEGVSMEVLRGLGAHHGRYDVRFRPGSGC